MKEKRDIKQYPKEAALVFLGAMLASLPLLITTYMQLRAQQRQLILDRQISALRDYSASYNKLATDVLPSIDEMDEMVSQAQKQSAAHVFTPDDLARLTKEDGLLLNKSRSWIAEVNTQTAIINALCKTNGAARTFTVRRKDQPNAERKEQHTNDEWLQIIRNDLDEYRNSTTQNFNEQQKIISDLSSRILPR